MPHAQDDLSNQRAPNEEADLDEHGLSAPFGIESIRDWAGNWDVVGT